MIVGASSVAVAAEAVPRDDPRAEVREERQDTAEGIVVVLVAEPVARHDVRAEQGVESTASHMTEIASEAHMSEITVRDDRRSLSEVPATSQVKRSTCRAPPCLGSRAPGESAS